MHYRKRILVPVVILVAVALWIPRQQRISAAQRTLEEKRTNLVSLASSIKEGTVTLSSLEKERRQQLAGRQEVFATLAKAERELAAVKPESGWVEVPSELPHWEPDSPYVWVRKEVMKEIYMPPFGDDGSLLPQAAPVLGITAEQMGKINSKITALLADYRKIEVSKVKIVDEHLPGAGPVNGGKAITISWGNSDEGTEFLRQAEATLREQLGDQRTDLLLAVDDQEFPKKFGKSDVPGEEMKITLVRHTKDSFNLAKKEGYSSMSTGSNKKYLNDMVEEHIPRHFRHFFAELIDTPKR